jgi:hypothetical protein
MDYEILISLLIRMIARNFQCYTRVSKQRGAKKFHHPHEFAYLHKLRGVLRGDAVRYAGIHTGLEDMADIEKQSDSPPS